MSNDWSKLILGDDNSQTAPICNGQVRDLLDELATLKRQRDMLLEALKKLVSALNNTTWSTWQTTARFADEWQKAEDVIAAVE